MRFRPLAREDVPWAVACLRAEGWGFDERDIERILRLGGGVVAVDEQDRRVGMLTHVVHGDLAWIGNVVVLAEARGRGAGAALVAAALSRLSNEGVAAVRLYAVLRAVSLYERLGFAREHEVANVGRRADAAAPRAPGHVARLRSLDDALALDRRVFGADRRRVLSALFEEYAETAFETRGADGGLRGFVFLKPSPSGAEMGPLVVEPGDEEASERLVDAALSAAGGPVEAGVRLSHPFAHSLLRSRGFDMNFPAVSMRWGRAPPPGETDGEITFAGMEKG
jgi:GNAT superfamily N-acetyltransferase